MIQLNNLIKNIIDEEKLKKYAMCILTCCNGEYGYTFYNKLDNHIFICLGDSSPFNHDELSSYIKGYIVKDYNQIDKIKVTIENEATPNTNIDSWYIIKDFKFIPINGIIL